MIKKSRETTAKSARKLKADIKKEEKMLEAALDDIGASAQGYLGNPLLKRAGEQIPYTPEHVKEYEKCARDPIYFAKYVTIINVDNGKQKIKLYDYQKDAIRSYKKNRLNITCSCRQSGKTTTLVVFFLWYVLFHKDVSIAILANKNATAKMILARIQLAYMHLPKFLQQGIMDGGWNKQSIFLENGCRIVAAATSSDSIRGDSFNIVYVDEAAFIRASIWKEFWNSTFPTISSGKTTKAILVSTPNGQNHFYDIWEKAKDGTNGYVPFEINWWDVPGRDENWKKMQIAATSEEAFAQEYGNSFLWSEFALVSGETITRLEKNAAKPILFSKDMKVFKNPEKGHRYIMSVDVANEGIDNSTFTLIDITQYPYEEVVCFKKNLPYLMFPKVIAEVATAYNDAAILIESNDIGQALIHALNNDYELNLISTRATLDDGRPHNRVAYRLGQRTTAKTKLGGCLNLKTYLETGKLIMNNLDFFRELRSFVRNTTGSYAADDPNIHDDLVMAAVNLSWYMGTKSFKVLYDETLSEEIRRAYEEEIEESILPLPIWDMDDEDVVPEPNDGRFVVGEAIPKTDLAWLL